MLELDEVEVEVVLRLLQSHSLHDEGKHLRRVDSLCLVNVVNMVSRLIDDSVLDRTLFILRVDSEVIHCQHELVQSGEHLVSTGSARELLLKQIVRNLSARLVMMTQPLHNVLVPDPVLQHLTRQLAEVGLARRAAQPRIF